MSVKIPRWITTGYGQTSKSTVITTASNLQLRLFAARMINRSGGTIDMGLLRKLANIKWGIGQWTDVGPAFTDQTSAVQAGTATAIQTTTNNDGFVVGAKVPWGLLGMNVSTATSGGSPVYDYAFWSGAAWSTLTTIAVNVYGAGTNLIVFPPPINWAKGSGTNTMDQTLYWIRVRATTAASGTAPSIDSAWLGEFLSFFPQVTTNGSGSWGVSNLNIPVMFEVGEGLLPYFGGSANAANMVEAQYLIQE